MFFRNIQDSYSIRLSKTPTLDFNILDYIIPIPLCMEYYHSFVHGNLERYCVGDFRIYLCIGFQFLFCHISSELLSS